MNQSDMNDSDSPLRRALGDLLDTAPSAPLSPRDLMPYTFEPSRRMTPLFVGAVAVAAVAAGGVVLASRSAPVAERTSPSSDPVATLPTATSVTVPVSVPGSVDRLAVAGGASDYYVASADLGEPAISAEWFESLVRCTELNAAGTTCVRIEGIAGVPLVSYDAADVTVDTTGRNMGSYSLRVGTTFTEVTPGEYATLWSSHGGEPVEVRGHEAVRFEHEGSPAVVWQERPGVLVWVVVPPEQAGDLLNVAEGVRRVDGPATIPDVVVVTPLSTIWSARSNNADGMVVAHVSGTECVGLTYLEGNCGDSIDQRTVVRHRSDGTTAVAGSTPAGVASVRVTTSDGASATTETVAFGPYASRFYATSVTSAATITVTWLAADGTELDRTSVTPERPDVEIDTTVPKAEVSAVLEQLKYRVDLASAPLEALGFTSHRSSTTPDGVTTITATDASGARVVTIEMTPGTPVVPENHDRAPIATTEHTATRISMKYASNDGWHFILVADTSGTVPLPTEGELGNLLYAIDP